jgi:hypothetical protein
LLDVLAQEWMLLQQMRAGLDVKHVRKENERMQRSCLKRITAALENLEAEVVCLFLLLTKSVSHWCTVASDDRRQDDPEPTRLAPGNALYALPPARDGHESTHVARRNGTHHGSTSASAASAATTTTTTTWLCSTA